MNDDALYEEVAREIQSKVMEPGLWTRAFAEANGSLDHARALYIRYRAVQLATVRDAQLKEQRRAAAAAARQRASAAFRRFILGLIAFICGTLTLCFGLGIAGLFSAETASGGLFMVSLAILFGFLTYQCSKASRRSPASTISCPPPPGTASAFPPDPFSPVKRGATAGSVFAWLAVGAVVLFVFLTTTDNASQTGSRPSSVPITHQPPLSQTPNSKSNTPSTSVPLQLPLATFTPVNNGILFSGFPPGESLGELTVFNGTTSHAVAKLIDARTDRKVLSFSIVSLQESYVTSIPDGSYKLIFAFGDSLYVGTDRFASPKGFSSFDKLMSFITIDNPAGIQYSKLSVTLNAVVGGNARTSSISKTEFESY